ncbi:DMT family transporter [Aestuariirhabdus haliotis]|uniref:DMT family transporter n=1 Tax=Aestuariirhabdus haliotis TaxID=2918751 RepID=UPI0020BD4B9A|nr:DMT family transporter [Aestuariirhabdus haliotis]MCL6418141.1 DMT family transporter [Aestuariirhabdus haliotis]
MTSASLIRLFLLAAIWGGSFLFMRMGAPVVGAVWLIESRVLLAALFLLLVALVTHRALNARRHWRHYAVLGVVNSALPFLFFGIAAQTLSASLLSILNATAPLWGMIIGLVLGYQKISLRLISGLGLGLMGVALLVGLDAHLVASGAGLAVLSALAAAFCYGVASNYARSAPKVDSFANAHGSMWAATLLIAPLMPFFPPPSQPGPDIMIALLLLGVVCSGMAYLLYFRLIADEGATSALTVTYLVPLFGVLWGTLLLDEVVGWHTLFGGLAVVMGTFLVTGVSWRQLLPSGGQSHG